MKITVTRRQVLKMGLAASAALIVEELLEKTGLNAFAQQPSTGRTKRNITADHDLVCGRGDDPALLTRKVIDSLGGMQRFVAKNAVVVVKPNMAWDRAPEYAGNTNPEVVAALVTMCYEAGAKRVNVFDNPCNAAQRVYENSGIRAAAQKAGAKVYFMDRWNFVNASIPGGSLMNGWPVYRDAVECDTFINVPVLKHHGLTNLTLSMKNMMGVCGGVRGMIHVDIGKKLVDITQFIAPDLTVIDAYRVLLRNGPSGGSLADVRVDKTVLASTDPFLADVYACRLMDTDPNAVSYVAEAIERGLTSAHTAGKDILEITV